MSKDQEWQVSEQDIAEELSGYQQPRSGGFKNMKGDVTTEDFLIEVKTTEKEKKYLSSEIFSKIVEESRMEAKIPLVSLVFANEYGNSEKWVFVPEKANRQLKTHFNIFEERYFDSEQKGTTFKKKALKNLFSSRDNRDCILVTFNVLERKYPNDWYLTKFDNFTELIS